MELTTRIQETPEPAIEGNRFVGGQAFSDHLRYVIVIDGGVPVAQQSFCHRGNRWWVDDLFVAASHRGTEVIAVLRETTFRALAEHTSEFRAWIEYRAARPERVLNDPIKRALGVRITLVSERRSAALYHYDISALRPLAQAV